MSIRWMTHVWDKSPYEGAKLLIHLGMADHANDAGWFFVSQTSLARKARCSVEYVRQCVRSMVEDGTLQITKKGHSKGRATEYVLKKLHNTVGDDEIDSPTPVSPLPNSDQTLPNFALEQPSYTTVLTTTLDTASPSKDAAKVWWESQNPRPIGRGAWHSLLKVCEAAEDRGYTTEQILTALNQIGVVPTIQQMDRALRNVQPLSNRQARLARGLNNVFELNGRKELE